MQIYHRESVARQEEQERQAAREQQQEGQGCAEALPTAKCVDDEGEGEGAQPATLSQIEAAALPA